MKRAAQCGWRSGLAGPGVHESSGYERSGRVRFFRRVAALAFILLLFGIWGAVSLAWLAAKTLFGLSPSAATIWVPVGTLLVVFGAALTLLRMLRRLGRPIKDVMEAAESVADGDYSARVAEKGAPPIRGLVRAFNTMAERLGSHEQQRRNLMADIAHELRTPLTIIQGKLEGLLDGVYPREDEQLTEILEETNLLSRLIEDLRTLALSETGALRLEKEPADVSELARDVVRSFANEATREQITLKIEAPPDLPTLTIDGVRIRQVLNNLLLNALQHTPSGGVIETRLARTDRAVLVEIHDSGSGMTREEVERAFERFQKGPRSRGSGLGLSIARSLVVAHGGEMRAVSQPGLGTTISFTIPSDPKR